jgi:hypothetical protein
MRPLEDDAESPLVVGDDAVADFDLPSPGREQSSAGIGSAWWVLGLGLGLVAMAVVGLVMRPASTPGTVDLGLPEPTVPAADAPVDDDLSGSGSVGGSAVDLADGPRQTVTTWSLPSGVWTWWPLGAHVVFVSAATETSPPLLYVHDKVSGRALWSLEVVEGAEMTVRDPASDDAVRFVVPGEPPVGAVADLDTDRPDLPSDSLVVSVEDGSTLSGE